MLLVSDPTILPNAGSQIDWSHPLARDLVFCSLSGQGVELVSGNRGSLFSAGTLDGSTLHGLAMRSSSNTLGGMQFPFFDRVSAAINDFTIISWTKTDDLSASAKLLSIPFRSTGWTTPFMGISFGRSGTGSLGELAITRQDNSALQAIVSDAGFLVVSGAILNQYAVTRVRDPSVVTFYRNGLRFGATKVIHNLPAHLLNKQPVCLLQRSNASNGEGATGQNASTMMWARSLSAPEIASLYAQPYQFLFDSIDYRYLLI